MLCAGKHPGSTKSNYAWADLRLPDSVVFVSTRGLACAKPEVALPAGRSSVRHRRRTIGIRTRPSAVDALACASASRGFRFSVVYQPPCAGLTGGHAKGFVGVVEILPARVSGTDFGLAPAKDFSQGRRMPRYESAVAVGSF
jgi:hypothetical protein